MLSRVLLSGLLAGSLTSCGLAAGGGEASCVARVEIDGASYYEKVVHERVPTTGGDVGAVSPACHDQGGLVDEHDEDIEVQVIQGVPTDVAVLHHGVLYVREGARLPPSAGAWDVSSSCSAPGELGLVGRWATVSEPHAPYFDGALDPPYEVGIRVDRGPSRLVDRLVDVQVTEETDPVLPRSDLDRLDVATLHASVRCDRGEFVAISLRTVR